MNQVNLYFTVCASFRKSLWSIAAVPIDLIKKQPGLRSTQMQKELTVPVKTLERWLKQLKEQDEIEFKGGPKTGSYHAK